MGLIAGKNNLMMETPLLVFNHKSCNIGVDDINRIPISISGKILVDDECCMVVGYRSPENTIGSDTMKN